MVKDAKKQKHSQKPDSSAKKKKKIRKSRKKKNIVHYSSSDSDSEDSNSPSQIQKLIEPYTKDQLIEFIITAAESNPTLYTHICNAANSDVSHRKIFVHGLGWDTTKETLTLAFKPYGEIEDCNVIIDRVTGKAKGFGFVQFRSRKAAMKALKEPQKKINNRIASCQLASMGPASAAGGNGDNSNRKIYVTNVLSDTDPERLRLFFSKFGEIEVGPLGFDSHTGKSRGFALFVYKNEEGLRKALDEPYKMFEGHQLHCQKAAGGKNKGNPAPATVSGPVVQQPTPQMLAQNFGLFGQGPMGLNPMYGGLFVNPNGGFIAANPLVAPGVMGQMGGAPGGIGGLYAGAPHGLNIGVDNGSFVRAPPPEAQGLGLQHAYPPKREESGSGSASGSRSQRAGGLYKVYPSHR